MEHLHWMSAGELAGAIAAGDVSAREALAHQVARVDELDGPVNAVVQRNLEAATAAATAADEAVARGDDLGPLHGVPVTVKDSLMTHDMVTTSGAPELADFLPEHDADSVARYRGAGAVVWGKTNLPIWAGDVQSYNDVYGTTANPWDIERSPGGSSGGSGASLAAGFSPIEIGSDIGGSIRNPSAMSGVCGHKPSYGVVSARGQIPGMPGTLTLADIAVVGPMARTVDDLELGLDLLAGPNSWDATAWSVDLPPARHGGDVRRMRVAAWLDDGICPVSSETRRLLEGAAQALVDAGATVDDEARPDIPVGKAVDTFQQLLAAALSGGSSREELEELASATEAGSVSAAPAMRHRHWLALNERRLQHRNRWRMFFDDYDVVLLPVSPRPAVRHDHSEPMVARTIDVDGSARPYTDQMIWMGLTGVSYLPATVVPVGVTADEGLPVGVQIAGPFLEDRTCLAVARAVEAATGGTPHPPGF